MLEVGGGLDLSEESLRTYHSREFRLEDLERNVAVVLEVLGQVHSGHASLAQLTLDGVTALEGCVQTGDGVGGDHAPKMRCDPAYRE